MDIDDSELERIKMKKMRELLSEGGSEKRYPAEPVEIDDERFDALVSSYPLVVVDFWAEWCAPCRAMAPIINELAKEMVGKVIFGKLNVDDNPATAARFGIMSIPTLIVFKDGKPVDSIVGAVPKQVIQKRIVKYID